MRCGYPAVRIGSVEGAACATCPDDHASIGKRAFLPPPESSGPGLLLRAARPTGPRWISRQESPPPLLLDWPRRAVLHSRAPEPCRLRRDDHEVDPLLADPTRHHGRAAPPGATPCRLRLDHPCRGAASRRFDSPAGLIRICCSCGYGSRLRPLRDHIRHHLRTFATIRNRQENPRPTVSHLSGGSTCRLRLFEECLRHSSGTP